jgi:foldase protein PrsA
MRSSRALFVCVLAVLGVALLAPAVGCGGKAKSATAAGKDAVVARVNGHEIHRSQVDAARAQASLSQQALTYQQALKATIDEELVREEAQRLGVTISAADLDRRLAQVKASVGDAQQFAALLHGSGLTEAAFKQRLGVGLLEERLSQAKYPSLTASAAQARTYYDQNVSLFTDGAAVDLGDIVVKTRGEALTVLARLGGGQSFADAARQFARDADGGRLGWTLVSSLPKELAAAVAKLRPGQLSGPVASVGGVHVLKLYGRRSATVVTFAQARPQIVAELSLERQQTALLKWLVGARRAAKIAIAN